MSDAEAREAIVRLSHDYAFCNDRFEVEQLVDLFTDDGVFDLREAGLDVYRGKDQVRDFFEREKRALSHVMHITTNHRIELEGERASGTVYYLAIGVIRRSGEENSSRGYYRDRYEMTAAGWRFSERVCHSLLPWTPVQKGTA